MAYRLLLPHFSELSPAALVRAMEGLEARRVSRCFTCWQVRDLAGEPEYNGARRLLITLHEPKAVRPEPDDTYFYRPAGVRAWVEISVNGDPLDRRERLHARLVALVIAEALHTPVLETRNGVYCRTPQAFAAWCSREPHPQTGLLAERDHVTAPLPRTVGVVRPVQEFRAPDIPGVPLPEAAWPIRLWRKLTKKRAYVIPIPQGTPPQVIGALVHEIQATFHRHNVIYQAGQNRLVLYAGDTRADYQSVAYFRRRAHPERLRLHGRPVQPAPSWP